MSPAARNVFCQWANLLPDLIVITDSSGTVLGANDAALSHFSWQEDDIVDRRLHDLVHDHEGSIDKFYASCLRTSDLVDHHIELRNAPEDSLSCRLRGSLIRPIDSVAGPVVLLKLDPTDSDDPLAVSLPIGDRVEALAQELDRRKQAQRELRASQARLRAIVDTAVDAIIVIDERGVIESLNLATESMFKYRASDLIGRNVSSLMPSPYTEEHDGYLEHYVRTGVKKIIGIGREAFGRRSDGSTFPMYLAVSEVPVEGKRYFAGIIRDLTEQRQLHDQIRQQEKLAVVGQLASGIAHEIGNPLSSISAVVQNLRRKVGDETIVQKLDLIDRHISRLVNITRQVSQLGRPMSPTRAKCSVNAAIENGVNILQFDKRARNVEVDVDLADNLPLVEGVADELSQVFMNLVLNSLDALATCDHESKQLRVATRAVTSDLGQTVEVAVEDNGPGMPEEIVQRVFDPFFTTKDPGQGTGLGLSVSHRIVEEHGGRIGVSSTLGKGTKFTIELPALAPDGHPRGTAVS